jgi:hypothetical protein
MGLRNPDDTKRCEAIEAYVRGRPQIEDLPLLRRALRDPYFAVVRYAIKGIRKLGVGGTAACDDLAYAAARRESGDDMPQAYDDAIVLLATLQPKHPKLLILIKKFYVLDNWCPIKASIQALHIISSPPARSLLTKVLRYWYPSLHKQQRATIDSILKERRGNARLSPEWLSIMEGGKKCKRFDELLGKLKAGTFTPSERREGERFLRAPLFK